uniref:ribosomal protein L13 n=1 Tax=Chroothece richteriana TaxID=101928 RepID=UPI001FCD0616|nr:ribosomal protein L13 [Chroothece richteriana]UNJ14193.1 ribosomal protein L13 [Chroothece richteriana]
MNKTYLVNKNTIHHKWYLIDAKGKNLGRLATQVANILRGKNKIDYTPYVDNGDFIIIINASQITTSGNKSIQKLYRRHSGRPGGMKIETLEQLQMRIPTRIIENAVKGMLPKNTLGRQIIKKLKVYADDQHPHRAQKPTDLEINNGIIDKG